MKVDLAPDSAQWVQTEIESGRFATAEDAVRHAIVEAKIARLRAELAAAEQEGGSYSGDDVRQYAQQFLATSTGRSTPDR